MKRILLHISLVLVNLQLMYAQSAPFNRGVNLTMWFQKPSVEEIDFSLYTQQDLVNIKSLGCDVIRLPINIHDMTSGPPEYTIDTLLFFLLDQVADWAEEEEMYLILDNHSGNAALPTPAEIGNTLIPVWKQMAEHFKDRSDFILYEILNEPHDIDAEIWNAIQAEVIDSIRRIDSVHTIIITPNNWSSASVLESLPAYADENLIATFHFYEPFIFTHQGAGWTDPTLENLASLPFPYFEESMPVLPAELSGTWVDNSFNNYSTDGTETWVKNFIDYARDFQNSRGIPVYAGELGVFRPSCDSASRINWYGLVSNYMTNSGIAWTMWDYQYDFGLFEENTHEIFEYDLNIPLLEAMGLNVPEQKEFISEPDTTGLVIYDDYLGAGLNINNQPNGGVINFLSLDSYDGDFALEWSNSNQYAHAGFDFVPIRDFSFLEENKAYLDLWLRGNSENIEFDIRFIDTRENDEEHPWRKVKRISSEDVTWDNNWHNLQILLSDFTEQGSWDNDTWYDPTGDFDWSQIEKLEFASESTSLTGTGLWFDLVQIMMPEQEDTSQNEEPGGESISAFNDHQQQVTLRQNYPNPFTGSTKIEFILPQTMAVRVSIYDSRGLEIIELMNAVTTGKHVIHFDGTSLDEGLFFLVLEVDDQRFVKKMIKQAR